MGVDQAERDTEDIYARAKFRTDRPPSIAKLCHALIGSMPEMAPMRPEACHAVVSGVSRIFVRRGTQAGRARWLVGHELAHWWYRLHGRSVADEEAEADLLGACIAAPRPAFLEALRHFDHSTHKLSVALAITQSLALLRIGETTGRPVKLLGKKQRTRGDVYDWESAGKGTSRDEVHPVKLYDERRWGLMVSRSARVQAAWSRSGQGLA